MRPPRPSRPAQDQVNRQLRVVVTYIDDQGTLETVTSVGDRRGRRLLRRRGGAPTPIRHRGRGHRLRRRRQRYARCARRQRHPQWRCRCRHDHRRGRQRHHLRGHRKQPLTGDAGNDTFNYTFGDGVDKVNGGADLDTLNILGAVANDTLNVTFNGTAITSFAGGTVTGVESVTANLLGGIDTLTYAATSATVTVNLATGTASGFTSIAGIENVTGGAGGDTLTGDGNANALIGGAATTP